MKLWRLLSSLFSISRLKSFLWAGPEARLGMMDRQSATKQLPSTSCERFRGRTSKIMLKNHDQRVFAVLIDKQIFTTTLKSQARKLGLICKLNVISLSCKSSMPLSILCVISALRFLSVLWFLIFLVFS